VILDPFCGSGTVALEASIAGFQPLVADINPMARLITEVKTTAYDPLSLLHELTAIVRAARKFTTAPEIAIINSKLWYTPKRKAALERVLRAIRQYASPASTSFFLLCFSVAARKLSNADPAVSVPVRIKEKESLSAHTNKDIRRRIRWLSCADAIVEFEKIAVGNIERVHWANQAAPRRLRSICVGYDARRLSESDGGPLKANSVPLIVSSPPYGSAQKYIRASSLSLNWLELAGPDGLKILEGQSIGREHVPRHSGVIQTNLPPLYEDLVQKIEEKNPARATITRAYLTELSQALDEAYRVLQPSGRMILTIGNNIVSGFIVENDAFVRAHLEQLGAFTELEVTDLIKTRGLMRKRNTTASLISSETVLVFRKNRA
jgi:hypothetical protein